MAFCARCGSSHAIKGLCPACMRELHPLIIQAPTKPLIRCPQTGRIKRRGRWVSAASLKQAVRRYLLEETRFAPHAQTKTLSITLCHEHPKRLEVDTIIEGDFEGQRYTEEYHFTIPVQRERSITTKHAGYFEATLQVRHADEQDEQRIERMLLRDHPELRITKRSAQRDGFDWQLSDKHATQQLAQKLRTRYGAMLTSSAHAHSYDRLRSKPITRITILASLPPFRRGDVIIHKQRPHLIQRLGRRVSAIDLTRHKPTQFDYDGTETEQLTIHEAVVSQTHPQPLALHPQTYQPVRLRCTTPPGPGEKVRAVLHRGELYAI